MNGKEAFDCVYTENLTCIYFYIIIYDCHKSKEKASEETLFTLAVASASKDCSDGFNFLAKLRTHVNIMSKHYQRPK